MIEQPIEIQRLIDRAAIQDVHTRYFRGIDAADADQVRSCFTADVRAAYDARASADGIDALMGTFWAFKNRASGQWISTTHFMGNLGFLRLEGDIAETEVYAIAFLVTPAAPANLLTMRSLRYLDRLRKQAGEWRICDRVHTLDWSCEVPATSAGEFARRITHTLADR